MNEITLNALTNLFALFSSIGKTDRGQAVRNFDLYLWNNLGITDRGEYLSFFEELTDLYAPDGEDGFLTDLDHQVEEVAKQVKRRLSRSEQMILLLRFLEMIHNGNEKQAESIIGNIASVFEISTAQLSVLRKFIQNDPTFIDSGDPFLLLNSHEKSENPHVRHLRVKGMDGNLLFLFLEQAGHFFFIFEGKEEITIGGNPIFPGRFYAFGEGSIIRGPRIGPVYHIDISRAFEGSGDSGHFTFTGHELDFRFPGSDNGLHKFSFMVSAGQLVAVMGGSGVGKSTLLNILNGNIPVDSGSVRINGHDLNTGGDKFQGVIGFVPQDDLLFEELTVYENLFYNARLCFDGFTIGEIAAKCNTILRELELDEYRNLKVGSPLRKTISGGQRKRLNIALELIREPAVLFVDEPTSGLSSNDSEKVMLLLKQQARKGKLIIVNIHQPSSAVFRLFDQLWILDKGGRPIYTGNPLDAILYFKTWVNHVNANVCECINCGNVNPEQVLSIIETKQTDSSGNFTSERRFTPEYWHSLYRDTVEKAQDYDKQEIKSLPSAGYKKPGLISQFRIFFSRNLRTKVTDSQYLFITLLEAPLLALIVAWFTRFTDGEVYNLFGNKSLISYLFMSIVVTLFMGMSISAEEIIRDRRILQRESFLNLSRLSYLQSKVLMLLLISAFQSLTFVLVGNAILGIHSLTFSYWFILFSVSVFANLLGLNISAAFNSVVTIYILIPLLLIPQILLCGVIVKFDDLKDKSEPDNEVVWAGEIMVSRWAFEALAVQQFSRNDYMSYFFELDKSISKARFRSQILITELIGINDLAAGLKKKRNPCRKDR